MQDSRKILFESTDGENILN